MIDLSRDRLQLATISSPRKEPKVSTFWRGGGNRRLEAVEVADEGVGVERLGIACWEQETREDAGGGAAALPPITTPAAPPTPPPRAWGEAVAVR